MIDVQKTDLLRLLAQHEDRRFDQIKVLVDVVDVAAQCVCLIRLHAMDVRKVFQRMIYTLHFVLKYYYLYRTLHW